MASTDRESLRQELLDLNQKRSKMESEMKEWQNILKTQKVGLNDSLVDSDGFPRNDIDIYQIRMARNKIIYLNNDIKNLMKQIEEKLFAFHALTRNDETTN
ncbi:26S proteasome non-ATPase regulatory subunit 9-like [Oppia nitens]|uniref:26S proteasome non-ATPase regulatory subunit 9-like n=1 Tax=Oppia nitens TaxID=1686743 RepID=UPI0023D9D23D|nr:26S proteasome non-ATPase regulatory subunit 9-like [Oppia nitens]